MSGALSIIDGLDDPALFQPWFAGETWDGWRAILKAAFAVSMSDAEIAFFRSIADRDPPTKRVRELWLIIGRRAGKDSIASVIAAHAAALFSEGHRLRPGERALVACLATDRDQARIVLNYTRSYFADIDLLKGMIRRETAAGFELTNGVDIAISTNSFRSVRGRPIICAILDECAFWRDETSATPDEETYNAIKPALASIPGSIIIGISSPHKKAGLLYKKFRSHFGKADGDVLVIKAPTRTLNPTIPQEIIDEALAEDPAVAAAEWLAEWRSDLAAYLDRAIVESAVDTGVAVRPPRPGVNYIGYVDAASGAGKDSYAVAIGHQEGDQAIIDCAHEIKPPFNPQTATLEVCALLKSYGVRTVRGDKYSAGFVVEAHAKNGIAYEYSDLDTSGNYIEALSLFTSGRVRLPDNPKLVTQFSTLERRTSIAGRDRVDHGSGDKHDDISAAVAGVLALIGKRAERMPTYTPQMVEEMRALCAAQPYRHPIEVRRRQLGSF